MKKILILTLILPILSCQNKNTTSKNIEITETDINKTINSLNEQLIKAAKEKDFGLASNIYQDDAILLAEYNPLIDGKNLIKDFYTQIFERQNLKDYNKKTIELFNFKETVLEIGEFKKTFNNNEVQEGKYWNFWNKHENGDLTLITEAFGFNYPIENVLSLRVASIQDSTKGLSTRHGKKIPIELDAYDSRNENIVRDRDTEKLINGYTDDGAYYPFAMPAKIGKNILAKHYRDYHGGTVKIDSIEVWTYDYYPVDDGIFKYTKFYLDWTVPDSSGNTQGTGLIYYRRQKDNSLKIHRQIGLHILNQ